MALTKHLLGFLGVYLLIWGIVFQIVFDPSFPIIPVVAVVLGAGLVWTSARWYWLVGE